MHASKHPAAIAYDDFATREGMSPKDAVNCSAIRN